MLIPQSRPVATLAFLALSAPGLLAQTQSSNPRAWILSVDHDATAHRAALEDLALWRRAQDSAGFSARHQTLVEAHAARTESLVALAESLDVEVLGGSWLLPSLYVAVDSTAQLDALRDHPAVVDAAADQSRGPNQVEANAAHNLPAAHATTLGGSLEAVGTAVTVALLDSGLDLDTAGLGRPHAAFYGNGDSTTAGPGIGGSRVLSSEGLSNFLSGCLDPEDTTGHGTRMGAVLAGSKWNTLSTVADGAAPDAWLRNFKVTDCNSPLASTVVMGMGLTAAASYSDVRVVNLSYDGTDDPNWHFNRQMDNAELAGLLIITSAGNSGTAQSFMHGDFSGLTVGASFAGQAEPYVFPGFQTSAIGPLPDGRRYPDLLAVGEQITTAAIDNEAGTIDTYGTSGAAALTSGTAALLFQAEPSLGPLEAKALLVNSLAPAVAGNADASGLGFLDSKAALDAALAGNVRDGAIAPGFELLHSVIAQAGVEFKATLTWGRQNSTQIEVDDLDLELRQVDGTVIARSNRVLENIEQLSQTFPQTTELVLAVRMPGNVSDPLVDYALAANFAAGSPVLAVDDLTAAAPSIDTVAPQGVSAGGAYARFFVKGTGLEQVTGVAVGGFAANFDFEAPGRLRVDVPNGVAPGLQTVDLTAPGGTASSSIVIGVTAPVLDGFVNFVGQILWWADGTPDATYGLFLSPSETATDLPGVINLGIGNQGASLFLVSSGTFNANGDVEGSILGGAPLPLGTTFYLQAVEFDFTTLSLIPSNVHESVKAIHFG